MQTALQRIRASLARWDRDSFDDLDWPAFEELDAASAAALRPHLEAAASRGDHRAAIGLGRIGAEPSSELLWRLAQGTETGAYVRLYAAISLDGLVDLEDLQEVVGRLLLSRSDSNRARARAARWLGDNPGPEAFFALLQAIADSDEIVRVAAGEALLQGLSVTEKAEPRSRVARLRTRLALPYEPAWRVAVGDMRALFQRATTGHDLADWLEAPAADPQVKTFGAALQAGRATQADYAALPTAHQDGLSFLLYQQLSRGDLHAPSRLLALQIPGAEEVLRGIRGEADEDLAEAIDRALNA